MRPLVVVAILLYSGAAAGELPDVVTYTGRLTDGTGWGQTTAETLTLRIYGADGGDPLLWEAMFPATPVVDGYFTVLLGEGTDAGGGVLAVTKVFADNDETWIGVCVGGACALPGEDLLPRRRIGSVPYAARAETCRRPSLPPGETFNLGWYHDGSGTVTIMGADGEGLSPAHPGWLSVPSAAAPGRHLVLPIEENSVFHDDDHPDDDLAGWSFGVTNGRHWNSWMPIAVYAINADDTGAGIRFAISRSPLVRTTPEVSFLGDKDTLPSGGGSQDDLFIIGDVDLDTYAGKPAVLVGGTMMLRPNNDADWYFQDSSAELGIGRTAIEHVFSKRYVFPYGQNGSDPGKLFRAGQETPTGLAFAPDNVGTYKLGPDGLCSYSLRLSTMETLGSNGNSIVFAIPYFNRSATATASVYLKKGNSVTLDWDIFCYEDQSSCYIRTGSTTLKDTDITHTNDYMQTMVLFEAY